MKTRPFATMLLVFSLAGTLHGADWPVYRGDLAHTGATAENLPWTLAPLWVYAAPAKPQTGMPAQGLTEEEARHIAAYLYTLGGGRTASYPPDPPPSLRREEPSLEKIDRTVTSPSDTMPRTRRIVPSQDGNVAPPR